MAARTYPGDDYILSLIAKQGYVKPDANRNILIGQGARLDGKSVGNTITKDNVLLVQSHDNVLNAKNIEVYYTVGITANGADHIVNPGKIVNPQGDGANYSIINGDAHLVGGYASTTNGYGCKNFIAYGICEGQECVLGRQVGGVWMANEFYNSVARGKRITIEGSHSVGIGENFKIVGDNITVIGIGTGQTITEPGVHILNQK